MRFDSAYQAGSALRTLLTLLGFLLIMQPSRVNAQCKEGNCRNGRGTYDFGWSKYTGDFSEGKSHGYGILDYGNYRYEGPFAFGKEHGRGTLFYSDGRTRDIVYDEGREVRRKLTVEAFSEAEGIGCVSGDCENGRGRKVSANGAVFEGEFRDGVRSGYGNMTTPFGDQYEGYFQDGRPHGEGTFQWASGYVFKGSFVDGVEHTGIYTHPDGRDARIEDGEVVREAPSNSRMQTVTFKIVGDRAIIETINGVDADGRKRLVLYTVGHVTRELYWSEVPVALMITVYEVDAPHDMDVETIRQKIYEKIDFRSESRYGSLRKAYPPIYVAPGTSSYDAKSYLVIKYGSEVWSKAEDMQIRLDW